jgi:hypothetical protein
MKGSVINSRQIPLIFSAACHANPAQLTGNSLIEFIIAAQNSLEYIDLKRSKIYVKAKIKHADGHNGGGSLSTWREPLTMGKQLVSFITCGCELSAPFIVIYKVN